MSTEVPESAAPPADRPLGRQRIATTNLQHAWEAHAPDFIAWARKPNHDSYWRHHRDEFLPLVPPAGRRTLDLGCGEGRLSRDLAAHGHRVVGLDASRAMIAAARSARSAHDASTVATAAARSTRDASAIATAATTATAATALTRATAAVLPFAAASFDCVVAFMSLHDIDDLSGTLRETHRVLVRGGRFCIAIVHPLNSAGRFVGDGGDSPFTIDDSYLESSYYSDSLLRDGMPMTFVSIHRPLTIYTEALADTGFLIERLREPALPDHAVTRPDQHRWQRVPLFMHIRAIKRDD